MNEILAAVWCAAVLSIPALVIVLTVWALLRREPIKDEHEDAGVG